MRINSPQICRQGCLWASRVEEALLLTAVSTLPFTQAFTLNLRFPLKVYEVALVLMLGWILVTRSWALPPSLRREVKFLLAFLASLAISVILRARADPVSVREFPFQGRFGPLGDSAAKGLYTLLIGFGLVFIARYASREPRRVIRFWLLGGWASAAYQWLGVGLALFGLKPLLLPGIAQPQIYQVGSSLFPRSGTFLEGNHASAYFLLCTALAVQDRQPRTAIFFALTVLATFSTIGLIGLGVFGAFLVWSRWRSLRDIPKRRMSVLAAAFLVLAALPGARIYLSAVVFSKLSLSEIWTSPRPSVPGDRLSLGDRLSAPPRPISLGDRLNQALTGIQMFRDHPFVGVGLSQYGYLYPQYRLTDSFDFHAPPFKRIPNNVYVEMLSETGLLGAISFLLFLGQIYSRCRGPGLEALRWGFVTLLVTFIACSTFSIFYMWAYWGILAGIPLALPIRGQEESGT